VYGLKDISGDYVQRGMTNTLFFDKRMSVVPYKSEGYTFKITTRDEDPDNQPYYLNLKSITKIISVLFFLF